MTYIDIIGDYKVYRNKDGFLEGFKTTGAVDDKQQQSGTNINHIVTNVRTIEDFTKWIKPKAKNKNKQVDPPTLFDASSL